MGICDVSEELTTRSVFTIVTVFSTLIEHITQFEALMMMYCMASPPHVRWALNTFY